MAAKHKYRSKTVTLDFEPYTNNAPINKESWEARPNVVTSVGFQNYTFGIADIEPLGIVELTVTNDDPTVSHLKQGKVEMFARVKDAEVSNNPHFMLALYRRAKKVFNRDFAVEPTESGDMKFSKTLTFRYRED
mgnify:CR=1 FL=1|jgi:hypothetical protein